MLTYADYCQGAEALRAKLGDFCPEALIILGSGLSFVADRVENPIYIPYSEVPHMGTATAPGHKGRFVAGRLEGRPVLLMQGRLHIYEGYSPKAAAYGVRLARLLGADTLITTNAVGAVNPAYTVGDIVMITDHMQFGLISPLEGPNIPEFGPRFPDMTYVYCRRHRATMREAAEECSILLREGVYQYTRGPQYETPAEIRAFRTMGADVVGMSTVPEAIVGQHAGMKVLGLALVTNMAAGVTGRPLSGEEVLAVAEEEGGVKLFTLLRAFLRKM